jgi:hypothetical protein
MRSAVGLLLTFIRGIQAQLRDIINSNDAHISSGVVKRNTTRPDHKPTTPNRDLPTGVLRRPFESGQYTSIEFGRRCRDAGVRPSMGSVGDAYDNAMCESFFATLESRFKTQAEARHAIFEFVEGFYNLRRRHSSIGYLSPVEYERRHPATRSIPTHTSLPSCSRPSRTNPSGGPKKGPSLTAAVRDGRTIVRAGTEEWLRPEPNQRMSRNGTPVCRQIR